MDFVLSCRPGGTKPETTHLSTKEVMISCLSGFSNLKRNFLKMMLFVIFESNYLGLSVNAANTTRNERCG